MRSRKKLNKRKIFIAAVFTAIIIITVICIDIKIKNKICLLYTSDAADD